MTSKFTDNFIRVGNLYVGHWDTVASDGGYAAKRLVEDKGVSLQGHTQRFGAHARTTVDGRVLLGHRKFLHVRAKGGLCFISKLAAGVFGCLSGTNFRTILVVPGCDSEGFAHLERKKI